VASDDLDAGAFGARLTAAVQAAGYVPRQLDVRLGRSAAGAVEVHIRADVPGLETSELLALVATASGQPMAQVPGPLPTLTPSTSSPPVPRPVLPPTWFGRLLVALILGFGLGVVGLPGLGPPIRLPFASSGTADQPLAIESVVDTARSDQAVAEPTAAPAGSTAPPPSSATALETAPAPVGALAPAGAAPAGPTAAPSPTAQRSPGTASSPTGSLGPVPLFAERFLTILPGWPDDVQSTAWFADDGYHLFAREPGRFVAVGVPLAIPSGDLTVTAHFRKRQGPSGGGYGIIVRDQTPASARDGRNQDGRFIVLEVGDQGDVGIWQRDQARWIDVLPWTHFAAVLAGSRTNELVASASGNALRFVVNGALVAEVSYAGIPSSGGVGVFAGGDLNEVVLEWLRIESGSGS